MIPVMLIILSLIGIIFGLIVDHRRWGTRKDGKTTSAPVKKVVLSPASEHIKNKYEALPESFQPTGLIDTLKALDVKHPSISVHFSKSNYGYNSNISDHDVLYCACRRVRNQGMRPEKCLIAPEFVDLVNAANAAQLAIREREAAEEQRRRDEEVAAVQHDVDNVSNIISFMKNETKIMKEVTRELR